MDKKYDVWNFSERKFEVQQRLTHSNAMGMALFCVDEDDLGTNNFAVIAVDSDYNPIWHEMVWCGQFHGYDFLYNECLRLGEIVEYEESTVV